MRVRALAAEGSWVVVGQMAGAIGAVVATWLVAKWLSPATYGLFSLSLTASTVGQMVIFGPWAGAVLRFDALAAADGAEQDFLATVLRAQRVLSAVGALLGVLALIGCVIAGWHGTTLLVLATLASVIAAGWSALAGALQSARRLRSLVAAFQGTAPWLRLLLVLGLTRWLGPTASAAMLGWALGNVLIAWSQWRFIPAAPAPPAAPPAHRYQARLIAYAAPFVVWGIFSCVQASVDRWALGLVSGLAQVGVYTLAYQIGYAPALLLGSVVEQMVVPVAFAGAGNALDGERLRIARRRVVIAGCGMLGLAVLGAGAAWVAEPLLSRFAPDGYRQAMPLVAPLFLSGGIFAAAQVLIVVPLTLFNPRAVVVPRLTVAVLAVAVLVGAVGRWGMSGLVVGMLAVSILYCAWAALLALRANPPRATAAP